MASLTPLSQDTVNVFNSGRHVTISQVAHDGGVNTVDLPAGVLANDNQVSVVALDKDDTIPTATITQQAPANEGDRQFSRVTLAGGDSGEYFIFTLHSGNAAAV